MLLITVLVGVVTWVAVLLFAICLGRAAKAGDKALVSPAQVTDEPATIGRVAALTHDVRRDELGVERAARHRATRAGALPERDAGPRSVATEPSLSLSEAADTLGVEPDVLVAWEARYHYPTSTPSSDGDLDTYREKDVIALASALQSGLSISAAVRAAASVTTRRSHTAHTPPHRQNHGAA